MMTVRFAIRSATSRVDSEITARDLLPSVAGRHGQAHVTNGLLAG